MIKRYAAGALAPSGTYLSTKSWEFVQISEDGGYLPQNSGVTYYRVATPLLILVAPLAGLAFVLFLPFAVPLVGLFMAFRVIVERIPWLPKPGRHELPTAR